MRAAVSATSGYMNPLSQKLTSTATGAGVGAKKVRHRQVRLMQGCVASLLVTAVLMCVILGVALHSHSIVPASALPFSQSSGVVELTPATLASFIRTHKPVYVMFYAPWCGHCKQMHPEWEKFAKATKGTVRVGAINADQYSEVAQQFNVRGFPTIKTWDMGTPAAKRKLSDGKDYNGQRVASSFQAKAMSDVRRDRVKTVATAKALSDLVAQSPNKRVAVLFSNKQSVPALFSVLSYSSVFEEALPFYFVGEKAIASTASHFHVTTFPTVALLAVDESAAAAADGSNQPVIATIPFKGSIDYTEIGNFFRDSMSATLEQLMSNTPAAAKSEAVPEQDQQQQQQQKQQTGQARTHAKRAMPVRPQPWTEDSLMHFCAPHMDISGTAPLCVISFKPAMSFPLEDVHSLFANEPVIFFYAEHHTHGLTEELKNLYLIDGVNDDSVVLLRGSKKDYVKFKVLKSLVTPDALTNQLQKALSGELRFESSKPDMSKYTEATK